MKSEISYDQFGELDLRVGEVVAASLPDWSEKLVRYEVDFGEEIGKRVMFSGIREWYGPGELIGKKYVFVVNMKYKKMGPEESQGMMMMAEQEGRPVLMPVDGRIVNGSVVR
ncbi:MAG: Methionine--tRNA ligase [Microgenomates group bacterium ADurb.Bin238]|jgi:methionyl-tRNA synthetase|nr:MAG: Methionine--tRNA ligase [Microgenomates group bacterium ADurb.Bin238]